MTHSCDRRSFLRLAAQSIGVGALYRFAPLASASAAAAETLRAIGRRSGERPAPFSFVQLSDTHVGFEGPPDPLGTAAFERAIAIVNRLPERPELAIFTGDLTHDAEDPGEHARRMAKFQELAGRLNVPMVRVVPGEHDAALDHGALFRAHFGETCYSFDHRGVHFVALDNVSRGKPEVGAERIGWLRRDLARFDRSTPIVVFTHRPLFDLRPEWEWFTSDGPDVTKVLTAYDNVTVLYGHIHRRDLRSEGGIRHCAARSLIFAFPDEHTAGQRRPIPFDAQAPFRNLGLRILNWDSERRAAPEIDDLELSSAKFAGLAGYQQILRAGENAI
jgi:hypothetical protein